MSAECACFGPETAISSDYNTFIAVKYIRLRSRFDHYRTHIYIIFMVLTLSTHNTFLFSKPGLNLHLSIILLMNIPYDFYSGGNKRSDTQLFIFHNIFDTNQS